MTNESTKKNRPTPTRKEAQAKRVKSSLAPISTKEEKKAARAAARQARINQREAFMRGDESALPLRDKGPARKFVRDLVDSRRSIGEFFLPIIFGVLILSVAPSPIYPTLGVTYTAAIGMAIMYGVLILSLIDGFFLARKIKKEASIKFPGQTTKGLGMYGWLRATQMRRTRMPKPQVKPGKKK